MMFFLYGNTDNTDEISSPNIDSIGITLNESTIWWVNQEIIRVNFMGISLCVICIDPKFRNFDKFISFTKNNFEISEIKSINFSRINTSNIIIEFDNENNNKYNLYTCGLNINQFIMMSGLSGLSFGN